MTELYDNASFEILDLENDVIDCIDQTYFLEDDECHQCTEIFGEEAHLCTAEGTLSCYGDYISDAGVCRCKDSLFFEDEQCN